MFSFINQNPPYNYFTITVNLVNEENEITGSMRWVYRSIDLYLQGYIINDSYRYFSDASLQNVTNYINDVNNNINLNFDGNYISLEHSGNFNWERIVRDINNIYNNREVRNSIITIPLITSESMRFPTVQSAIRNSYNPNFIIDFDDLNRIQMVSNHYIPNYNHPNQIVSQGRNWDFFQPIVTNWDRSTQESAQFLRENSNTDIRNLVENFLSFLNNRNRVPINWNNPQPLRIMVAIFSWRFLDYLNQCNSRVKRMTELICYDQNWTNINKLTDYFLNNKGELYSLSTDEIKPNKVNIKGKVTTMQVLDENTKGGNLKEGDIYVGTTNGFYLIHSNGDVQKFNNIDEKVTSIKVFDKDKIYITTKRNEIYFLRTDRLSNDGVLFGEKLDSAESSDLNKELKLRYPIEIQNDWYYEEKVGILKTFNLGKINPSNYNKIDFLWKLNLWVGTYITWGDNAIYYACIPGKYRWTNSHHGITQITTYSYICDDEYETTLISALNKKNSFADIVSNLKISENDKDKIKANAKYLVQDLPKTSWGGASIEGKQYFGLNWYEENYNYYFQFLYNQWATCHASTIGGKIIMLTGNGIRLYNDDTETQIPNPNDRKRREIFEEKNLTKWTNEFTKSINHEQHLAIDNNKTNFVKNNMTSL